MPVSENSTQISICDVAKDCDIRYVPLKENETSFGGIAHLSRYEWVKKFLKSDFVSLDMGCGCGYGSYMLASYAKHVDGIDISENAINYGREVYRKANLNLFRADCTDSTLPDQITKKYDVIVSFDVIEHISDHKIFFLNVLRLLNRKGLFICGTPNKNQTLNWNKDWNPYHKREFTPEELKSILNIYFHYVKIIGQDIKNPAQKILLQKRLRGEKNLSYKVAKFINRLIHKRDITKQVLIEDIIFGGKVEKSFGLIAIANEPKIEILCSEIA